MLPECRMRNENTITPCTVQYLVVRRFCSDQTDILIVFKDPINQVVRSAVVPTLNVKKAHQSLTVLIDLIERNIEIIKLAFAS